MKYCPYCGVVLADSAAPFCAECGKRLNYQTEPRKTVSHQTDPEPVKTTPKPRKAKKQTKKIPQTEIQVADDGYDGYYNDTPTEDDGHVRASLEKGLIKRIIYVSVGALVVIALAVIAIYYL